MNDSTNSTKKSGNMLRIDACRKAIWPDKENRPSLRTFKEWKKRGYFPEIKVGRSVYLIPEEVEEALVKRFTIRARNSP